MFSNMFSKKKTIFFLNDNINASLFHDEDPYHIETSPLICRANQ